MGHLKPVSRRVINVCCPNGWRNSRWHAISLADNFPQRLFEIAEEHGFPVMAPPKFLNGNQSGGVVFVAFDFYEDDWRPFFNRHGGPGLGGLLQMGRNKKPVPLTIAQAEEMLALCGPGDIRWPKKLSKGNSSATRSSA